MTNDNIDDQIRDALDNFHVEYNPDSWDMLAHRMDADPELAAESANQEFDQVISNKIKNTQAPYQSEHWKVMAERIQLEFSLRSKLIRYKVAEVGLVLLAIFTIFNVFPSSKQALKKPINKIKERIAKRVNPAVAEAEEASTISLESANQIASAENVEKKELTPQSTISNSQNEDPAFAENANTESFEATTSNNEADLLPTFVEKTEKETLQAELEKLEEIEQLTLTTTEDIAHENQPYEGESIVPASEISNSTIRIGMFTGVDYNYITTPYDPIYDLDRYSRFAPGYQAGLALGFKSGSWEIETGGIYASKTYHPRIPTEIIRNLPFGGTEVRFDNIQLNMLEVPVNFRYHFGQLSTWRFYGQTGASIHLALQAHYDRFPANIDALFAGTPQDAPLLDSKEFPGGLLDNGSIEENSYFTANLGFGVERLLSTRWSLFLQPNVKAYLLPSYNNGLGPNQDRLSSFSILTGTRVTLW